MSVANVEFGMQNATDFVIWIVKADNKIHNVGLSFVIQNSKVHFQNRALTCKCESTKAVGKSASTLEFKMKILCGLSRGNETVFLAGIMNSPEPFLSLGKTEGQLEG